VGEALAKEYSAPGMTLFLGDIEREGLEVAKARCEALGATVGHEVLDVTDRAAMESWISSSHRAAPLDLVLAIAGVSKGSTAKEETPEEARQVFAVNLEGTLNTFLSSLPAMRSRGSGQIALMSSLAGTRGFPVAPSYCASKAALRVYGESWRARLMREHVFVTVINPGFIHSPMTRANPYPMPFLVDTGRAARTILRRLEKAPACITFPWPVSLGAWCLSFLPSALFSRLMLLK